MRGILKASEKLLADRLPPWLYFPLQDRVRPLLDRRTVRGGRTVRKIDDVYEVLWRSGESFYFAHPRRYCRYMYENGLEHILSAMLAKYQDGEVQLETGDVVFEVGANVGEFTLAALRKNTKVYAAEPDPHAVRCLCENVPQAQILGAAIGHVTGTVTLNVSTAGGDSSIINAARTRLDVPLETISSWLARSGEDHIDFLKIEAEGFEPEVLEGARPVFEKIRKIAIDCGPERNGKPTLGQCYALLCNNFRTWRRGWMLFAVKPPQI